MILLQDHHRSIGSKNDCTYVPDRYYMNSSHSDIGRKYGIDSYDWDKVKDFWILKKENCKY